LLGKVKRPKLLHKVNNTNADTTISKDGGMASGDIDNDDKK